MGDRTEVAAGCWVLSYPYIATPLTTVVRGWKYVDEASEGVGSCGEANDARKGTDVSDARRGTGQTGVGSGTGHTGSGSVGWASATESVI